MEPKLKLALSLSLFLLSGCGSTVQPPEVPPPITTPEQALAKLTPEDRANFQKWESNIVKKCFAAESFPGASQQGSETDSGIDLAHFFSQTNQSFIVYGENGDAAIVGVPELFSANGSSRATRDGSCLDATFVLKGSSCQVFLFGQKVYDGVIVKSFPVNAIVGRHSVQITADPKTTFSEDNVAGVIQDHGYDKVISAAMQPTAESTAFLAKTLGVAPSFFALSGKVGSRVFILQNEEIAPFSDADLRILGASRVIQDLPQTQSVSVLLSLPQFEISGLSNASDTNLIAIQADINVGADKQTYSVQGTSVGPSVAYSDSSFAHCFNQRLQLLDHINPPEEKEIQPPYLSVSLPCEPLSLDPISALLKPPLLQTIDNMFSSVSGSPDFGYSGWDNVVIQMASRFNGKPDFKSPVLQKASTSFLAMESQIQRFSPLASVRELLLVSSMRWAFRGQPVSSIQLEQIVAGLENVIVPFRTSTMKLLHDLEENPTGSNDILEYAVSITPAFKELAQNVLELSFSVSMSDWAESLFNSVLQMKVSEQQLKDFQTALLSEKKRRAN
jgi:hypothetical protein